MLARNSRPRRRAAGVVGLGLVAAAILADAAAAAPGQGVVRSQHAPLRVGLAGDSWVDLRPIPEALRRLMIARFGDGGTGFIPVSGGALDGAVSVRRGWSLYDLSTSRRRPPSGCGPDGQAIYTSGRTASFSASGVHATQISIFSQDGDGSFRYRIDQGPWTPVTGAGSGRPRATVIRGLSDSRHRVEIDTADNAGTVTIFGLLGERTGFAGATTLKLGNAGATGRSWALVADEIRPYSAYLSLDVLVIVLGTNDYRLSLGVGPFVAGVKALIAAHRAANPRLDVILVAPAQSGVAGDPPLRAYRDALQALAIVEGAKFYSMYDDFGPYDEEAAVGQWADRLHLSDEGAKRSAAALMRKILEHRP